MQHTLSPQHSHEQAARIPDIDRMSGHTLRTVPAHDHEHLPISARASR